MDLETIINTIKKTGLSEEDINKKILEKQQELSNLVSKEGAAYIIAKEMGLDIFPKTKRRLEIKNVVPRIRELKLSGRVVKIIGTRDFESKGRKGKVASIILADSTGSIRLSLWDNQTEILGKLKLGDAVETFGAYTKEDGLGGIEIRLGKTGGLKILEESELPKLEEFTKTVEGRRKIEELKEGETAEIKAALVQLFETNIFYDICPECGGRVIKENDKFKCSEHGFIEPKKAIVLSGIIDDGTGNMRAVFFRDNALKLTGMNMDDILEKKDDFFDAVDVLGKEFIIGGRVRRNKMFNRLEFIANSVKEIDIESEINKVINNLLSND